MSSNNGFYDDADNLEETSLILFSTNLSWFSWINENFVIIFIEIPAQIIRIDFVLFLHGSDCFFVFLTLLDLLHYTMILWSEYLQMLFWKIIVGLDNEQPVSKEWDEEVNKIVSKEKIECKHI